VYFKATSQYTAPSLCVLLFLSLCILLCGRCPEGHRHWVSYCSCHSASSCVAGAQRLLKDIGMSISCVTGPVVSSLRAAAHVESVTGVRGCGVCTCVQGKIVIVCRGAVVGVGFVNLWRRGEGVKVTHCARLLSAVYVPCPTDTGVQ
jgi:hypothetical protein